MRSAIVYTLPKLPFPWGKGWGWGSLFPKIDGKQIQRTSRYA